MRAQIPGPRQGDRRGGAALVDVLHGDCDGHVRDVADGARMPLAVGVTRELHAVQRATLQRRGELVRRGVGRVPRDQRAGHESGQQRDGDEGGGE